MWEDVLWVLQNELRSRGLHLTLVDMYLGSDLDPVYDRHALDEHLREIQDAHTHSAGPFFLVGNSLLSFSIAFAIPIFPFFPQHFRLNF